MEKASKRGHINKNKIHKSDFVAFVLHLIHYEFFTSDTLRIFFYFPIRNSVPTKTAHEKYFKHPSQSKEIGIGNKPSVIIEEHYTVYS